ncbi:hypothetical protein MCP1_130014 [Candidatus Terasakiella magnetica]|nr:hypothetical protein MCP1_130014 [Candidatus Terasakiella magnetica]
MGIRGKSDVKPGDSRYPRPIGWGYGQRGDPAYGIRLSGERFEDVFADPRLSTELEIIHRHDVVSSPSRF